VRNQLGDINQKNMHRAGFTTSGPPSMLSVRRTLQTSLSRRIALSAPARAELHDAEERYEKAVARGAPAAEIAELEEAVRICRERVTRVPFLDDLDLRYRHRVAVPAPVARAVMFCMMDVSG